MRWIATVLLLLGLVCRAGAADWFVSPQGNDESSGASPREAWRTIARANATAAPGDTVHIRAGTYSESIAPQGSGTEAGRITFRAFGDETVTLTDVDHGIVMQNRAYVTVDGIDCIETQAYLLIDNSHDIWIRNCVFDRSTSRRGGPKGVRIVNSSHHNRIQRCRIGRAGYVAVSKRSKTGLQDRGGLINIGNDTKPGDNSHYNLIEGNTLAYGSHHVMMVSSSYNVIRDNYFHNEPWMPDPTDPDRMYGNRCIGGGGHNSERNLIENNRIAHAGRPPDDDGAYGIERPSGLNIYRRNALHDNGTAGIGLHSKWHGTASRNYVYANTFYRNGTDESIADFHKGGISIQNYRGVRPQGNIIKNNIFYRNVVPADRRHADGAFAVGGNVSLDEQSVSRNWLEKGDPLFANAENPSDPHDPDLPDLRLRANSPCVDTGDFLTRTTSSGRGREIPVLDAGYFTDGWGIVEGDRIQLEGTTLRLRVLDVDYEANILSIDREVDWRDGQGVSLPYEGARPDLGAFEFGSDLLPSVD